jgi:hypothetical protein
MSKETGAVLVGCPTYAGKEYCLNEWVKMFYALEYEPKWSYMVDNTRGTTAYFETLKKKGIDCSYLEAWPDWDRTFLRCWELILSRAQALNCYWIYSVEADNIPAPESLQVMVNVALYANLHLVMHSYPMHKSPAEASGQDPNSFVYHELGCMLMSRRLLERSIAEYDKYGNIALAIQATCANYEGGSATLTNKFEVKHLDGYEMAYANLAPTAKKGLIFPSTKMPDDFGTVLPPSLRENAS